MRGDGIEDKELSSSAEAGFRTAQALGGPTEVVFDAWASLKDDASRWQALLEETLAEAARLHPSVGTAVSVSPDAVAIALFDNAGRLLRAGSRFLEWVGDPSKSLGCRRLIRRAQVGRRALGLVVSSVDGAVLAVAALGSEQLSHWQMHSLDAAVNDAQRRIGCALIVFAPSRSTSLLHQAAEALGLSPLQSRLAEALVDAPSLSIAADSLGISRETAKDALKAAVRKANVTTSTQLIGRLIDVSCEITSAEDQSPQLLQDAMNLTPAEARVASAMTSGGSAQDIGQILGLSPATVRSYRESIFAKTSVNKSRDMRRLISEVTGLDRITSSSQVLGGRAERRERLKVIAAKERNIAFIDYGPASGACLIIGHGFSTGRLAPNPFVDACDKAGYRIVIPQRPGFGLTDPAAGDYLETAANDLARILDHLRVDVTRLMSRDCGTLSALAFASGHAGRLDRPVLINPSHPGYTYLKARSDNLLSAMSRFVLDKPALVEPFTRMILRHTRYDIAQSMFRRLCAGCEADRRGIEEPGAIPNLIRDLHGMMAQSCRGAIDEGHCMFNGWRVPDNLPDDRWTVAHCGGLWPDVAANQAPWRNLPNVRFVTIAGAGLLAASTHTDDVMRLLA